MSTVSTQAPATEAKSSEGAETAMLSNQPQKSPPPKKFGSTSRSEQVAAAIERVLQKEKGEETHAVESKPEVKEVTPPPTEPEPKVYDVDKAVRELELREQKLRSWEKELKALEREKDELKKYKSLYDSRKEDPLKYIKESGLDVEDVIKRTINDGNPSAEEIRKRDLENIDSLKSQVKQLGDYIRQKEATEALNSYKKEVDKLVSDDDAWVRDYCELVESNLGDLATKILAEYYQEHGEPLSPSQTVETLKKAIKPRWDKLTQRFAPQPAKEQPKLTPQPDKRIPGQEPEEKDQEGIKDLSWEQKKARLAESLRFLAE
jgi:hypothetical protein